MKAAITVCLALAAAGGAAAQEGAPAEPVVVIEYRVTEQLPEAVERTVLAPVERVLKTIDRVAGILGTADEGRAVFEVAFPDGAGRADLAAVAERIEALRLAPPVEVVTRTIGLGKPSPWWTSGPAPAAAVDQAGAETSAGSGSIVP